MDNFTVSVLIAAAAVILGFVLMMVFDKKKDSTPGSLSAPAKPAGK